MTVSVDAGDVAIAVGLAGVEFAAGDGLCLEGGIEFACRQSGLAAPTEQRLIGVVGSHRWCLFTRSDGYPMVSSLPCILRADE